MQTIRVTIDLTANHLGYFEFRVCNRDELNAGIDATQECLNKHLLQDSFGNTRFLISSRMNGLLNFGLRLTRGLKCNNCVLQWKYHAGNNWGTDSETGQSCLGCGPQEEFYGCADIKINPSLVINETVTQISYPLNKKPLPDRENFQPSMIGSVETPPKGVCQSNNFYSNLNDGCRTFYSCASVGTRFEQTILFKCPENYIFDNQLKTCSLQNSTKCKQYRRDRINEKEIEKMILADFIQVIYYNSLILSNCVY